jgi:hypothetical protein
LIEKSKHVSSGPAINTTSQRAQTMQITLVKSIVVVTTESAAVDDLTNVILFTNPLIANQELGQVPSRQQLLRNGYLRADMKSIRRHKQNVCGMHSYLRHAAKNRPTWHSADIAVAKK